jgi:HPt (histidine-containing phosphotransfer) domain-containing protein
MLNSNQEICSQEVAPGTQTNSTANNATAPISESPPFKIETLVKRMRGKTAIIDQVLDEFSTQVVQDIQSLTRTIRDNDVRETASVAHAIKGAAGLLCAQELHRLAAELEGKGLVGDLSGAEACLAQLKAQVDTCLAYGKNVIERRTVCVSSSLMTINWP